MTILQRLGQASAGAEVTSRSKDFAELVRCLMLAKGDLGRALNSAGGSSRRVVDVLKTDVPAGTLAGLSDVAGYRILSEGFSSTLNNSAFDSSCRFEHRPFAIKFCNKCICCRRGGGC